jgi:hypothetical protein
MIINFKSRKINRGIYKLIQTLILIIIIKNYVRHHDYDSNVLFHPINFVSFNDSMDFGFSALITNWALYA